MTQTIKFVKISAKYHISANGKINVQKIGNSWVVGKNIEGSIYYGSLAGFDSLAEALTFAEGVEA